MKTMLGRVASFAIVVVAAGCAPYFPAEGAVQFEKSYPEVPLVKTGWELKAGHKTERAILAAGCFWGVEARFREVPGVVATAVGYTGGHTERPTYKQVCNTNTGHAEAIMIEFDPSAVTYSQILAIFWDIHNPTTMNRQGPDVGSQYRSAIYVLNDDQKTEALESKTSFQRKFSSPIVTEITKSSKFWPAETYHQQYHQKTGTAACPIDTGNRKSG